MCRSDRIPIGCVSAVVAVDRRRETPECWRNSTVDMGYGIYVVKWTVLCVWCVGKNDNGHFRLTFDCSLSLSLSRSV